MLRAGVFALWCLTCFVFSVSNMDLFEDPDYANVFITQEPSQKNSDNVIRNPAYSDISDDDSLIDFDLGTSAPIKPNFE